MRRRILLVAAAVCLAAGAIAQQRLVPARQPNDPISAAYEADVRRVLGEAFGPGVTLRAVVGPALGVEYAVGLRRVGDRHEIFALRPSRSVWDYQQLAMYRSGQAGASTFNSIGGDDEGRDVTEDEIRRLQEGLPADPADLPLTRCAVAVDGDVAAALQAAWRRMLEEVRPGELLETGADGSSYLFSMGLGGRALSGFTWSPRDRTRPARLARLAEAMRVYCETREAARLRELTRLARQLS
jgi:hypothetical protein